MTKRIMPLLVVLLSLSVAVGTALAVQSTQIPIAGKAIPQFMQPLPLLNLSPSTSPFGMATVFGNQPLTIRMCEFWANMLPLGTITPGVQPKTRVWGYIVGDVCPANGTDDPALDTYLGPVIVNERNVVQGLDQNGFSTDITWVNDLGNVSDTQVLAYKYSTDQTLHWADPGDSETNMCNHMAGYPAFGDECSLNYGEDPANRGNFLSKPIPAVVHLHGGEVPPQLDGGPDAWFTSDGSKVGHSYFSFLNNNPKNYAIYKYPNSQEASPIWFHDHTLGVTRLGVYAGLAGAYYIQDNAIIPESAGGKCNVATDNCLPANLQKLAEVVPIVLQDRTFDTKGQLFMQADSAGGLLWATNPEHPYWTPEFVGDTIVVNGKAWPFLAVQAKRYRFLFLNGSNARTYEMSLINQATGAIGPPMWVIATDGGYLDAPVKLDPALGQKLLMQPGERYEVIIDFTLFPNTNLIIRNTGRTPFPKGAPPNGSTLGRIMQFRVGPLNGSDASYNPAVDGPLRKGSRQIVRLVNPATGSPALGVIPQKTRQLTLNEVMGMPVTVPDPVTGLTTAYPGGPLEILVNNTKWSGERITGVDPVDNTYIMIPIPNFTGVTLNGNTTYYSETPKEGETEVWEIVNLTADAHPIHLHLVQFQIQNRQNYNVNKYTKAYAAAFPGGAKSYDAMLGLPCAPGVFCPGFGPPCTYKTGDTKSCNTRADGGNPDIVPFLQGAAAPPLPYEAGWKDTAIMYPGQVTRIAVRWAPTDLPANTASTSAIAAFPFDPNGGHGYVWHCHIIDHEDNEMMRPNLVEPNLSATRGYTINAHY